MSEEAVDPLEIRGGPVGPWVRAEHGPRGTRLVDVDPPEGPTAAGPPLGLRALAPRNVSSVELLADGRLALALGPAAAFSIRVPEMGVVHTRRPPGLSRIAGASVANAGLLHDEDGWRIVVLPSLGDIATGLGPGPLAMRPDARAIALQVGDTLEEIDLTSGETTAAHEITPAALAYAGDGSLLVASGSAVTAPGQPDRDGSSIRELRCASRAWTAAAAHADGTISVWELAEDGPRKTVDFPSPLGAGVSIGLSADGARLVIARSQGDDPAVVIARADDGALERWVAGARCGAVAADGELLLGAEWGLAFLRGSKEDL